MFQFLQLHDVFICEVVDFSCFVLQQENFTSGLKSSEVELWKSLSFTKAKGYHKVLRFVFKSSYLRTHDKYNINKKIKSIVVIHVCNEFDMRFW